MCLSVSLLQFKELQWTDSSRPGSGTWFLWVFLLHLRRSDRAAAAQGAPAGLWAERGLWWDPLWWGSGLQEEAAACQRGPSHEEGQESWRWELQVTLWGTCSTGGVWERLSVCLTPAGLVQQVVQPSPAQDYMNMDLSSGGSAASFRSYRLCPSSGAGSFKEPGLGGPGGPGSFQTVKTRRKWLWILTV